jgi:hypothetical protein
VKKGGLERAHSECLVSAKALAHAYAGAERKRIKGGNREGVSILGQVDEDLEERRESAKLNRMRFQCDSYRRKWSVWNAAGADSSHICWTPLVQFAPLGYRRAEARTEQRIA